VTALVAVETLLLVLLILLVAGLLRSHAEILRRLGPPDAEETIPSAPPGQGPEFASDLVGETLDGEAVKIGLGSSAPPTLIAFLTSGCGVCHNFWDALRGGPPELGDPELRLVVVTKDRSYESPSRLAALRPAGVPVIMSSAAWDAYGAPGSPYFAFVRDGALAGGGSGTNWDQIATLMRDAEHDARAAQGGSRADRIDDVLRAAGIGPDHPSLHPGAG
jgi:hypothetical protein